MPYQINSEMGKILPLFLTPRENMTYVELSSKYEVNL